MRRELIDTERAAFDAWWDAHREVLPDAQRADGWTFRDVVAHVAAWHRCSTERIAVVVRDGADPGPPDDVDRFNRDARAGSETWQEIRDGALQAQQRLLDVVASIPEERLAEDDELIPFIVRVNGSEHYDEHPATDLDAEEGTTGSRHCR